MSAEEFGLNSSHLAGCVFDPETGELQITFQDGSTYNYANVPAEMVSGLRNAISPGRFFAENLKGRYEA